MRGIRLALFVLTGVVSAEIGPPAIRAAAAASKRKVAASGAPAGETRTAPESPAKNDDAAAGKAATFESLVAGAAPMGDVGTLLAPWSGKCEGEKRELDRVRCRSAREYLRKVIPRRSFWAIVDDPAVIGVSEYDAAIKGYHVSVAGCIACTRPVTVGRMKDQRFITVKAPVKEAESLRGAVEVSRNSVGFDSLAEAKAWLEQSRPDLRTQFVFQPAETEWTFGANRGHALTLLGLRVFNRCTGEILMSRPPSTGSIDIPALPTVDDGCRRGDGAGTGADASSGKGASSDLPGQMSKNDIDQAMKAIRPQVFACFEQYKIPGTAQFDFVVAGNGTVNKVRLSGAFFGTPTGVCLLEAAKDARFPRFSRERQQFLYPFFLRQ